MNLSVTPPEGAEFVFEEVKTAKGTQSLGEVPILRFNTLEGLIAHIGEQGVLNVADGTSLRVSYQNIARRAKAQNKSDDEIAEAQVRFRPGNRAVGASTPTSRAARAAKVAAEKGVDGDKLAALLDKIAKGELNIESLV
jgi:anti-sigma28 factor (negative regulator of flagellin synthesis)